MRTATLIKRNLVFYWRTNAAVVLGVAVAVSVLGGALLVGDSVRASLRGLFLQRLGKTDHVITSTGFFRERLADELQARAEFTRAGFDGACPLVVLNGLVAHDENGRRAAGVQVYGVDERFWRFHGREAQSPLGPREALLSASLARELGAADGAAVRLRVEKISAIPVESLHGRKDEVGRTLRLTVREVLAADALGDFSLRPQQGEVRAIFVPLAQLQKEAGQQGKANAILLSRGASGGEAGEARPDQVERLLRETFTLEDLGAKVRALEAQNSLSLESDSALLSDELSRAAQAAAHDAGLRPAGVFSYLANTIRAGGREIPYSLVTAIDQESFDELARGASLATQAGEAATGTPSEAASGQTQSAPLAPLLLNEWAAADLGARPGDEVSLDYYVWREEGRLATETAQFRVAGVVPIRGLAADRELTPEYPGISGTESLSEWDPPFPVELSRVRQKDEDYWEEYRTTPKAFIPLARGQQLWRTRFGGLTSLRFHPPPGVELSEAGESLGRGLRAALDPLRAGLSAHAVREEGLRAAEGATDFGEYFLYFSFFIVVSALLLASLFFKLGVEQRVREIGLLQALGFPAARIRNLFLAEGALLAALGSLLGVGGALLYGALMMWGLRTWWVEAVGTRSLALHVAPLSLALGAAGGILAALLCVWWTLRALSRVSARGLLGGTLEPVVAGVADRPGAAKRLRPVRFSLPRLRGRTRLALALGCSALGGSLLVLASLKLIGHTAGFFGAGVALLVGLLCFLSVWLRGGGGRAIEARGWWSVARLGFRGATHRPGRSVLCVALVASATFIIVAVDAFRQDGRETSTDRRAGGGGYPLFAETLLPVTHDPNTAEGREALNLSPAGELEQVSFTRFRVRPGDDASCLNLYRPRNPKILGATPDFVRQGRFGFQDSLAQAPEEKENPWLLLEREAGDGTIPVIADAKSMAYVLHRKLGDEIVIDGAGGAPVRLRLVAALADSLFQSELLMSEKNFLRLFPEQQGYRFFLLDAPRGRAEAVAARLEEQLSDFGFDALPTAERLAAYHRVENTYLSTFQTLGGLGTLLGTLGLAAVLLRNVLERRRELALLRAVGYGARHVSTMIVAENALLLLCGLAAGTFCALLSVAPALFARAGGRLPNASLLLLLLAILLAGFAASLAATFAALRTPLLPTLRAE